MFFFGGCAMTKDNKTGCFVTFTREMFPKKLRISELPIYLEMTVNCVCRESLCIPLDDGKPDET